VHFKTSEIHFAFVKIRSALNTQTLCPGLHRKTKLLLINFSVRRTVFHFSKCSQNLLEVRPK